MSIRESLSRRCILLKQVPDDIDEECIRRRINGVEKSHRYNEFSLEPCEVRWIVLLANIESAEKLIRDSQVPVLSWVGTECNLHVGPCPECIIPDDWLEPLTSERISINFPDDQMMDSIGMGSIREREQENNAPKTAAERLIRDSQVPVLSCVVTECNLRVEPCPECIIPDDWLEPLTPERISMNMALSESQIPPDAQHYLVCGTEDCEKNCQFYCNDCQQPMCEQCRDEHQKNKKTKNHEVVHYKQRKRPLPVEKCKIHPTRNIELLCEECQIPICSKCTATKEHRRHAFTDLELVFSEKCSHCHIEITKIQSYFEPTSQDLKKEIAEDVTEIKKTMATIRTSMKAEAETVKKLVDTITSDKIEQVDKIEQSLLQTLNGQNQRIDDYINYLNDLIKTFHGYLSPSNIEQLTYALKSKNLVIRPIPETSKPVPPIFTAGQNSKENVAKLLGRITIPNTKPENRKIKPMETAFKQLKPTGKQRKQDREQGWPGNTSAGNYRW